ncbi:hypothetical protein ACFYO2_26765 [Streptomyces sp. NPDC006602]|uniref:hypothetical protein n=1 Tax=Streptomyces sp. NPDC006602 TaxID=3364751 RepID=UPI0036CF8B60
MINVTDAQVRETLHAVVSERPEFVYSSPEYMENDEGLSCFYVHDDEDGNPVSAGCVVGVVLNRLGVPLEELKKHEGKTAAQMVKHVVTGATRSIGIVLSNVQFDQDEGASWGEAYAKATGETI